MARKAQLKKIVAETDVQFSESFEIDGGAMYKHACSIGLEGLVSKVRDSPYVSGRTHDWAKKTCAQREIAPDRWLCPRWQRIRRHLSCPPKRQGPGLCRQGRSRFYHTSANDLQARLKPLIRKTQPYTKK